MNKHEVCVKSEDHVLWHDLRWSLYKEHCTKSNMNHVLNALN